MPDQTAQAEFIKIDGVRLEYRFLGRPVPGRPTLVFLHEGLGCLSLWRQFPERLAQQTGLPAFIYSRAGYGQSDPAPLPRPIAFMHQEAEVLARIMAHCNLAETILVGHSDGASIALIYTARSDNRNVQALVLEAPHVFTEPSGLDSIAQIAETYRATDTLRSKLRRHHGTNTDIAFRGWNDVWLHSEFRAWNIEAELPQIKVPMLIIQGETDAYGTWRQVEAIRQQSGGPVEAIGIPDCGHAPHREHPEVTLAAMADFIHKHRICKT